MAQESKNIRIARASQDFHRETEKLYEEQKIDQIVNEQEKKDKIKKIKKKINFFIFELCETYDLDYAEIIMLEHKNNNNEYL